MIGKVHIGLDQSKGILFDRDPALDGIPEEETKSELESQGVVSVKRFTKKMNLLNLPILTFLPLACHICRQISKWGCIR